MSRQKDILGAPPRGEDQKRNQELKQALTRTHFTFGDEPMVYERTSTLPDPTGHLEDYTGVLNTEVRLLKNSCFLLVCYHGALRTDRMLSLRFVNECSG